VNGHEAPALFLAVLFAATAPIIVTWRVLVRWPWIGLRVIPSTAFSYIWQATLVTVVPAGLATLAGGVNWGAGVALLVGAAFAYQRSLVGDLWNVRGVMNAIRAGDRVVLVRRGDRAIERLLRFRNYGGARVITAIAGLMSSAGALKESEQILARIPVERYLGLPFWHILHTLTLQRIKLGAYVEAEKSLDRCGEEPPTRELDREHRYFRALVEAATGKPKRALKRLEKDEAPEHDVVAAHAYVALGKEDLARAALEQLKKDEELGAILLQQIAKGHGPANGLALRVLGKELPVEEADGPYR
jgi:hypothetical protein